MRVDVWYRPEVGDGRARRISSALAAPGDAGAEPEVSIRDVYIVAGVDGLTTTELAELVSDPISQEVAVAADEEVSAGSVAPSWDLLLEVVYKPGVTDPVAGTLRQALTSVLDKSVGPHAVVQTARQYRISGSPSQPFGLFNPVIQSATEISAAQWRAGMRPPLLYPSTAALGEGDGVVAGKVDRIDMAAMSARELNDLSAARLLALSAEELQAIADYYADARVRAARERMGIGAAATDVELEMLAQTWSEHCKHKIFNAQIEYTEGTTTRSIDSLFDTYIRSTTKAVAPDDGFLRSVFHDNSGVVEFDRDTLVCFKVETHNSPSALDPYGGAITGIVGVNRDILGTGRGARPLFNTNVLCFAPPDTTPVPTGLLPPRQVLEGVHRGIVDGGNQSGIPVVGGAFLFHPSFVGKPLVFCGTGGIMPSHIGDQPAWESHPEPGDLAVMVGGRIGKDGIHGATFSSLALDDTAPLSAVQIGDPIVQKRMSDLLLEARDRGLFRALTDNGAGGLSSSFGEMARECGGVKLHLDQAPLKYSGLAPWEILLSEAQERMSLAVAPEQWPALQRLAGAWDVEATAIGEFTQTGAVELRYAGALVGLLDLAFLHDGLPPLRLRAEWPGAGADTGVQLGAAGAPRAVENAGTDVTSLLLRLLADPNIASKQELVRQYDHEVQANTIGKPFTGVLADGPSDGAVLQPRPDSKRGLTVTHGICPWYSAIDPYHMAMCAVDEAVRAHVACGGDPHRMTALDNFCWPDPIASDENPDGAFKLGQLVRAAEGLSAACRGYRLPLISGKDSMKNDAFADGRKISVLPTLLVSLMGIIPDVRAATGTDFLRAGDLLFVVGVDRGELGASSFARATGEHFSAVPTADPQLSFPLYEAMHAAIAAGQVASVHDLADGGLAVTLAESAIGGRLGAVVDIGLLPPIHTTDTPALVLADGVVPLFSETAGRFLVSVQPAAAAGFTHAMGAASCTQIGEVSDDQSLTIRRGDTTLARATIEQLVQAWQTPI